MSAITTLHNTSRSKVEIVLLSVTLVSEDASQVTPTPVTNKEDDETTKHDNNNNNKNRGAIQVIPILRKASTSTTMSI